MLCGIFFQIFSHFRVRTLVIYNDQTVWNLCLLNSGKQSVKILQSIVNRHDYIHLLLINSLWIILSGAADMTLFEMAEISDTLRIFDGRNQEFLLSLCCRYLAKKESSGISVFAIFQKYSCFFWSQNGCLEGKSRTFRIRISDGLGHIRTVNGSQGALLKLPGVLIKDNSRLSHLLESRVKSPAHRVQDTVFIMEEIHASHAGRCCFHALNGCRCTVVTENFFDEAFYLRFFARMAQCLLGCFFCCFLCCFFRLLLRFSLFIRFLLRQKFFHIGKLQSFQFSLDHDLIHFFRVHNLDQVKTICGKECGSTAIHGHMHSLWHQSCTASTV